MKTYIINKATFTVAGVLSALEQDEVPLCPVCGSLIKIARTPDEAKSLGIPPGMQCSKSVQHFQVEFNLRGRK